MISPFPTFTLEEAIAMLPDGPMIDTRYETVPNCGITKCAKAPREHIIALIQEVSKKAAIFQSGPEGMKLGFAMHFEVINYREGTCGNLFVKTRNPN